MKQLEQWTHVITEDTIKRNHSKVDSVELTLNCKALRDPVNESK